MNPVYLNRLAKALLRLEQVDINKTNAYIRTILGLKSIRSSAPNIQGSRTTTLENGHKAFGITALYTTDSLNLLTALIASSEFDEDIAILNKPVKAKLNITIEKQIPDNWKITKKSGYVKRGTLIAKGPDVFDEIRASISGHLSIARPYMILETTQPITTGSKIQNIFLQKHVLKYEPNRFKFVDINKRPVTDQTIENLKQIGLKPIVVNILDKTKQPTLVAGSSSVLKRRSSGTLAQLWLGFQLAFPDIDNSNDTNTNEKKQRPQTEHDWNKEVYVTKLYDTKRQTYHDAIVGIGCWLVAINSNGYEYKIASKQTDVLGRHINSVSIDPFATKVLIYRYPEIAETFLKYQIDKRKEKLSEYLNENFA